jgi:hypothetical protein
MAKRYQKVLVTTWIGETIRDASDAARVLFFYLLSGPETTLLTGLVPVNVGTIANRLRWPDVKVREAFAELDADGAVAFDDGAGVAWLPNAIEHNPPMNPNVVRSWERAWDEVPKCPLKVTAYQSLRRWCEGKGASWLVAFDAACRAPRLSGRNQTGPQKPASGNYYGNPSANGIGNPSPNQKQYQEQKQQQNQETQNAGAGAPAYACTHEGSPDTSPAGHVVAEVVSTEPPPSRTPPAPVEVVASSPTVTTAPSSHATGPLAASAAQDDDEPPPAQRCPSTPRPGASVQAAPPVTPAPPVATPSAPAQPSLLPDLDAAPAEDAPPVAIPRVADLDDRTPANRVLRAWGSQMYRAHQQPLATEARRRVVRDRLRVFSEADLIRALTGALTDPYVNGRSDRAPSGGQRDIAWLFAKVERVEGFLRAVPAPPPPPSPRPAPRMPPPLKPGEVRPVISVEDYERNAFAPVLPRRMTAADLAAYEQGGAHVG